MNLTDPQKRMLDGKRGGSVRQSDPRAGIITLYKRG